MYAPLKNFFTRYDNYMTMKGREDVRQILLNKGNRALEDMGISPYLLNQGVDAWPWREGEVPAKPAQVTAISNTREQRRAIRELRSMSNAELSDLGITRGSIPDVVKNGRAMDQAHEASKHAA